ncbi:MAG: tetratricopeptide repeat protein [Flavobacterium sp.]|nr:MAG: tetratricopeptide repeat protein [Flavobacterium sp.]
MKTIKRTIAFTIGLVMMGGAASFAQSLADAKKVIDAEQYQKATGMLKTLTVSQAKEGDVYFNLGNVYLAVDEVDSAKAVFTKGTIADPKNALNFVGLGHVDLYTKNAAAAKANFDKAIELGKKDYHTYMHIGKAYFENPKPDFDAALPNLLKADELETKDKDPEVFIALGDFWADQKNNSKAYEQYSKATDIDPNIKRVAVQVARMIKMADGYADAEKRVKDVIGVDANYGPAYRELAEIQLQWSFRDATVSKAKREESLTSYKKYLDLTDKSFESRFRYVQFLLYSEDWNTLATELQTLKVEPNNPKSFIVNRLLGYSAVENKNYDLGVKHITQLFAKKEDAPRIVGLDYLYLGRAYQGVGNDSLAIVNLVKGVELDTTKVEELATLGQKLYTAKRYGQAADVFKKVISLNSKNLNMAMNTQYLGMANYWNFAIQNNEKKNPSPQLLVEADTAFAKVLKLVPDYEMAAYYRVRVAKAKDTSTPIAGLAAPFYEKFIELVTVTKPELATKPANVKYLVEAYNYLGAFYANAQDKEKAKEYFNKTLALDPQNTYATETLKILNGQAAPPSPAAPPKKSPIK